jgi:hypothetical protein
MPSWMEARTVLYSAVLMQNKDHIHNYVGAS